MLQSQRRLFREPAVQHYLQKREKDILPHFVSPPTFICIWILLCLAIAVGLFASTQRVPIQVDGVGMVLAQAQNSAAGSKGGTVLVFLPVSEATLVHIGEPSQLQIGLTGPTFSTTIAQVEHEPLSPSEIYQRYASTCSNVLSITGPSVVVHVAATPSLSSQLYAGSPVRAQIQIGTQRLLSWPGLNALIGD
jgi:hypothetical protein